MNIQPINTYNTSFNGIKLSTDNFETVREMVMKLKFMGINCAGHKSFITKDILADKAFLANYMRTYHPPGENRFGVLFFPSCHEAYIVADKLYEQKIINNVQKIDKDARINLMI